MAGPGIFDRDLIQAASNDVTVTPSTATLTLTRFVPVIKHTIVVPVKTLALTTFAPSVTVGVRVTPTTASLTLTTFAPTVTTSNNQLVTPGTLALTTARFAPVIKHQITVPVKALSLATFAPVLKFSIIVPKLSLTLTMFAPTVTVAPAAGNVTVTPGTASLIITQFPPTVTVQSASTPPPPSIAWRQTRKDEKQKEKPKRPMRVTPAPARLYLTAYPPSVSITANMVVSPAAAVVHAIGRGPLVVVKPSRESLARAREARLAESVFEAVTVQETLRVHRRQAAEYEPILSAAEIDALDFADLEEIGAMR
jgi:hypothetical protein